MKSYSSNVMINVKTILRLGSLLISFFMLSNSDLNATHIVGGDLSYRCLGNNIYQVKLTMRRDCFQGAADAQFDDPASIGIFDMTTGQLITDLIGYPDGQLLINFNADDTLNEILISDCSVISGDVCVHTTMYIANIVLPYRATGYTLAYQRCCRNSTLNNIVNPLLTGMTLTADLSATAQLTCNSSPQFGPYPGIYICANKDIHYDHHAVDLEGDSLVYSLCTPSAGATKDHPKPQPPNPPPFDPVVWKSPYFLGNLLGGDPLKIDPVSGLITGKPNTVGQFVVGICVTAYIPGTNIITGTARRDYQVNVRACRDVPVANFSAPELSCESQTITFTNTSLLGDKYEWFFDFGNPLGGTSTDPNPVFTYPQGGCFRVALVVSDSLEFCHDTAFQEVCAFISQLDADFDYDVIGCFDTVRIQITDLSIDPGGYPLGSWSWLLTYNGNVLVDTGQNPQFNLIIDEPTTVFVALLVTSANGCTASQTKSFPVRLIGTPDLFGAHNNGEYICNGESVHLLLNGDSTLTYTWDPTLGLDITRPWDPIAYPGVTTEYFVTVTDGLCEVTGHTVVIVQQLPILGFESSTDCLSLTAEFTNSSTNAIKYYWDFGVPNDTLDFDTVANPIFTFPDSGVYTVTLESRDGCDVSISHQVTVNNISETLDETSIDCFNPTAELNPDNNPGYIYTWSNGSHDPNPVVTVSNDETFTVTITSPGLPGCEIVDSIRIIVPDDFTVNASESFTNCKFIPDTLIVETNGNKIDFVWTLNGDSIGTGTTLIVKPDTTTTYTVTGTDTLGCTKTDVVTISKPHPFDVVSSNDTAYCGIQIITLHASSSPGVTFKWYNESGDLIGEGSSVEVTPGTPSCFYAVGSDALQCEVKGRDICLKPTFFDLSISNDASICRDEQTTLAVTNHIPEQEGILSYSWTPLEYVCFGGGTAEATVCPPSTTEFCAEVTNDELGCKDTLCATVIVNLFDPIDCAITASKDSIIVTESTQLFVNQDPNFTYVWSSTIPGEDIPPVWNPVVTPTGSVTYTVTVTNAQGCICIASKDIGVANPPCNDEDIFLPNAFSPNDDGVNDMLFVRSNFVSTLDLHIYNRWGEQVFQTQSQSIGWDGKYKGKRLEPDVFGYYMNIGCPNGRTFSKKGNITLLE